MSRDQRIQQLQALLERVRRRASSPRASDAVAFASPVVAEAPSEMRAAAPAFVPEAPPAPEPPRVSGIVAAPQGSATLDRVDSEPVEALGEEDLIEMSSDVLESVPPPPALAANSLDFEDEEEEPPISSERHRVGTIDQAVAAAEREPVAVDEGREVPLKTPPPESGPQEAALPLGMYAPLAPDVDQLLEAELAPPTARGGYTPTTEQLGQTVDLEEARGPELELAPAPPRSSPPPASEELEAPLPPQASAARYHEDLLPPPEARAELEAHRQRVGDPAPLVPSDNPEPELASPASFPADTPLEPEVIERPPISRVSPVEIQPAPLAKARPSTFLELLDASIALGG